MFLKNSRYYQLPDEVTVDIKGRRLVSKSFRQPPQVTGTFQHTIEDGDRLDHLSYKYYEQSRKWWHICDANPEFMSPQALLGKSPAINQHFPLSFTDTGSIPPWAELLREIAALAGVENVRLADDEFVTQCFSLSFSAPDSEPPWAKLIQDSMTLVGVKRVWRCADSPTDLMITYSQINTNVNVLIDTIKKVGFKIQKSQTIGQNLIVTYNSMTIREIDTLVEAINKAVEAINEAINKAGKNFYFLNLSVGHPQTIGRTGNRIVIPPNLLG